MIRVLHEQVATPTKLGPLDLEEVLDWTAHNTYLISMLQCHRQVGCLVAPPPRAYGYEAQVHGLIVENERVHRITVSGQRELDPLTCGCESYLTVKKDKACLVETGLASSEK
jgi:hypothetical protein